MRFILSFCLLGCCLPLTAADLAILPGAVELVGAGSSHRLLVVLTEEGRVVRDVTAEAKVAISDAKIADFREGHLHGLADGTTTLNATFDGNSATTKISVKNVAKPQSWGFLNHVQPVLTRTGCNSGACHGALAGKGGFKLSLRGYDVAADHFAITRQASARRVDSDQAAGSLLLKKALREMPHGGGTRFESDAVHYRILKEWIGAGGRHTEAEPALTSIQLLPAGAVLKTGQKLNVLVLATYADGTRADVTAFAKFTSSLEGTATVDEDGLVSVTASGEAGISALFGSRTATIRITVPFPGNHPASEFAPGKSAAPLIDDLVLSKLKQLNIPPSYLCSDEEFIRRVYLDSCGILPKPEEVDAFLADARSDKRRRLIDLLLQRPEYVDYWTHAWSDLMLVSSRKLPAPAMWAFYRSVRRSVAENQPWDRFARSIVTASGSTLANGGGNYFVLHKDVTDLAETTTVTFLGMSINCCRCHNHPLEKWTQDQYWAFANQFSRVSLKNTGRAGEVIVGSRNEGEALHLRTGKPTPPAALDALPMALDSAIDRREAFADWLTNKNNPYFAKALVNRVWRNYLGRGLVEAEDDLRDTNPATNPELLQALADDFVEQGYDVKQLMRLILNSHAYQRSAKPRPENAGDDRFYSHYLLRRLRAETILDAYADIAGVPTKFDQQSLGPSGGTAAASYPAGTRAMQLPDSLLISRFLDAFGRAERVQTCSCERTADSSVSQALHLNNGQTLNDKLRDPKSRLSIWIAEKRSNEAIVVDLFRYALSRRPTADETKRCLAILAEAGPTEAARREALEDLFWAVLTGKEFLFNH